MDDKAQTHSHREHANPALSDVPQEEEQNQGIRASRMASQTRSQMTNIVHLRATQSGGASPTLPGV